MYRYLKDDGIYVYYINAGGPFGVFNIRLMISARRTICIVAFWANLILPGNFSICILKEEYSSYMYILIEAISFFKWSIFYFKKFFDAERDIIMIIKL